MVSITASIRPPTRSANESEPTLYGTASSFSPARALNISPASLAVLLVEPTDRPSGRLPACLTKSPTLFTGESPRTTST